MVELASLEEFAELLDVEAVRGHVGVLGVPISQNLINHGVQVSKTEDPPDASLLGQLEHMDQGVIFSDIVRSGEVDLQHVMHLISLRRDGDDAGS
jgi:hypothetical protein